LLGVDWGTKRIGVAVGDTEFKIATTRPFILATGTLKKDAQAIVGLAKKEMAEAIVIGLPLRDDEEPSQIAKIGMKLADHLTELGQKVFTVNEALSSIEAENRLKEGGLRAARRKDLRDSQAATVILERYFHEESTPS
jgi:putative Holliday junction resolvase